MIRAVIFDLDDTLYPERQFTVSGFDAVAAAFAPILGPPEQAAARMRALFDTPARPRVFDTLLAERAASAGTVPFCNSLFAIRHSPFVCGRGSAQAELVAGMVACYRAHTPRIALYDDADRALKRLATGREDRDGAAGAAPQRYWLGLITDGPAPMQRNKVIALGLADRLDEIILTDELGPGYGKPDPRAFELTARRLNVPATACAYVADNPAKDFEAPRRLGWRTVRVLRADGVYAQTGAAAGGEPEHTITTLDDLERALRGPHSGSRDPEPGQRGQGPGTRT